MPPTHRGDIIFADDSQGFPSISRMVTEFGEWANYFKPNMVFFQIGYRADKPLWQTLDNPPKELGAQLAQSTTQPCGVFWVDFTLRDVMPEIATAH